MGTVRISACDLRIFRCTFAWCNRVKAVQIALVVSSLAQSWELVLLLSESLLVHIRLRQEEMLYLCSSSSCSLKHPYSSLLALEYYLNRANGPLYSLQLFPWPLTCAFSSRSTSQNCASGLPLQATTRLLAVLIMITIKNSSDNPTIAMGRTSHSLQQICANRPNVSIIACSLHSHA